MELVGGAMERKALVDFGDHTRLVSVITLPDTEVGAWIVVHSGFAIRRLSEDEAADSLAAFRGRS